MRLDIEEIIAEYKDRLFAAAFSICKDKYDAEDAVQETFIKYYTTVKQYENEDHIRAWLIKVVINKSKDMVGSFWRRNKMTWEDYMSQLPFAEPEDSRLFEAVMELPEKYRVVIHLFYYEEYSIREIAKILNRQEGTVKSQLSRGRGLLKQTLKGEWEDE